MMPDVTVCRPKRSTARFYLAVLLTTLISGCATIPKSHFTAPSWKEINAKTPSHIDLTGLSAERDYSEVNDEMRNALADYQTGKISRESLIAAYGKFDASYVKLRDYSLTVRPNLQLIIPANSQVKLQVTWYCLGASQAFPSALEFATWEKGDLGNPYYAEILRYAESKPDHDWDTQRLIWGLQAKVPYDELLETSQHILSAIDPNAPTKLTARDWTSKLKNHALQEAKDYAGQTSAGQAAANAYSKFEDYDAQAKALMSRTSKFPPIHLNDPEVIDPDPLFQPDNSVDLAR